MRIKLKIKNYNTQQAAKIPALSSGKIYKYEYLTFEEIFLSDQIRIIEHIFKISYILDYFEYILKSMEKWLLIIQHIESRLK